MKYSKSMVWAWSVLAVSASVLADDAVSSKEQFSAVPQDASIALLEGDLQAGTLVVEFIELSDEERTPLYSTGTGLETFESGFPDAYWTVGDLNGADGTDSWDDVICNPLTGTRSAWSAGNGSEPDCVSYDDNMESFMCVEAMYAGSSLNSTDRFYFNFWNEVEACCDYMWVSIGGFSHEPRHGIGVCTPHVVASQAFGSTSACGGGCPCYHGRCWTSVRVRLGSGFDHTPFLRICFRFHSDPNTTREGTYFDDIRFNGRSDTRLFPIRDGFDGHDCAGNPFCGGIAGRQCPDGEECYFGPQPGLPCGTTDRIGECKKFPPACPTTQAPVCGCNGVTYQNDCFAARADAEVAHDGPCCTGNSHCLSGQYCIRDAGDCMGGGECVGRPISCPGTIDHVCGCDGQTYDNPCKAGQAGVSIAHLGSCTACPGAPFTIGGAIYSDCTNPITTGLDDIRVNVTCGTNHLETTTNGPQGLWQIPNLPCGACTVCPHNPGLTFAHVGPSCQEEGDCHTIVVNEANQGANQSIQFVGNEEDCTPFDLNYDGFPSIIGDVPLAVDCIYRNNCHCPEQGCLCPADCNCDGFLTIIGDVPCLVDCFYRQLCADRCTSLSAAAITSADLVPYEEHVPRSSGVSIIGGAIYTNLEDPFSSGLTEVAVTLSCAGRPDSIAMSSGGQGLWSFSNVSDGTCTLTPTRSGYCFEHVMHGVPGGEANLTITVDDAHMQQNQSIQFLASTDCNAALGACCLPAGTCSMAMENVCTGRYLGAGVTCSGDSDDDAVFGCADSCPSQAAPAGVDATGRPLGDLNGDCTVELDDFQILQNNFSGR